MTREPYIDVRGPYPTLIIGLRAYQLFSAPRSITVEEALKEIEK